jgi:MFS family permease
MALFQALAHRSFLLLWGGQTISRLGDSLYQIALAWWVLEHTGSATAMGTVFICTAVPTIVFVLLGGVAVDRRPRIHLMLGSDLLRCILLAVITTLAAMQRLELWQIYVASLLFGFVNAFFLPAYTALIPEIIPKHLLPSANALTSVSADVTGVVGPAFGAYLVHRGGIQLALAFDTGSFVFAVVCLVPLLHQSVIHALDQTRTSVIDDLQTGFQVITATSWLWMTVSVLALLNLTGRSPMNVALPFLVHDAFRADVDLLGILYTTFSCGSIVGAVGVGRFVRKRRRGVLMYRALILVGLMTLALGLALPIPVSIIAMFTLGAALAVGNVIWSNILQELVPIQVLGRVASIMLLGSTSLLPIGFGLTGWATDRFGPALVFVIGGTLTASVAILGLCSSAIQRLE